MNEEDEKKAAELKAAEDKVEQERVEAEKAEAEAEAQAKKEAKTKGKGKLICMFHIKGEDKAYKPGDVYDGKNTKYLLSRGSIQRK